MNGAVSITRCLNNSLTSQVGLIPQCPYVHNYADKSFNIPMNVKNQSLLALAMIHTGYPMPPVTEQHLTNAQANCEADEDNENLLLISNSLKVYMHIRLNWSTYNNWYILLVACHQVRAMTDSNIEKFAQYAKTKDLPDKVITYLHYFASTQPILSEIPAVRARFQDSRFFQYHTTECQTAALCKKAQDNDPGVGLFSKAEIQTIKDAHDATKSIRNARLIQDTTMIKAHCMLTVLQRRPEKWYMCNKVIEDAPAGTTTAMIKILKKAYDIATDTSAVDKEDATMEDMKAAFGKLYDASGLSGGHNAAAPTPSQDAQPSVNEPNLFLDSIKEDM